MDIQLTKPVLPPACSISRLPVPASHQSTTQPNTVFGSAQRQPTALYSAATSSWASRPSSSPVRASIVVSACSWLFRMRTALASGVSGAPSAAAAPACKAAQHQDQNASWIRTRALPHRVQQQSACMQAHSTTTLACVPSPACAYRGAPSLTSAMRSRSSSPVEASAAATRSERSYSVSRCAESSSSSGRSSCVSTDQLCMNVRRCSRHDLLHLCSSWLNISAASPSKLVHLVHATGLRLNGHQRVVDLLLVRLQQAQLLFQRLLPRRELQAAGGATSCLGWQLPLLAAARRQQARLRTAPGGHCGRTRRERSACGGSPSAYRVSRFDSAKQMG
jgi:hypothetical protein